MQETTVKIELGKEDLQYATIGVIKQLTFNPPIVEDRTTAYYMGVQVLFDVLESDVSFKIPVRKDSGISAISKSPAYP